jgi:hypothetical protein
MLGRNPLALGPLLASGGVRWGAVSVALVLVAVACAEGSTGRGERAQAAGQPGPANPTIERYSTGARPTGEIHAVGTTLLAYDGTSPEADPTLLRSVDLGETWEPLVLPGTPDSPRFRHMRLEARDGVVWVAGVEDATDELSLVYDSTYLWISRDGTEWQGGRLPTMNPVSAATEPEPGVASRDVVVAGVVTSLRDGNERIEMFRSSTSEADGGWVAAETPELVIRGGPGFIGQIWRTDDGPLVADVAAESLEFEGAALESGDGRSWRIGSCPDDSVYEGDCHPASDAGSLEFGPQGVSVNDGEWEEPVLEPSPAREDRGRFGLDEAFELAGGGWLAEGYDHEHVQVLARSDDGMTWQQVLVDDSCRDDDLVPSFSRPVRLGAGWLVEHSCSRPTGRSIGGGEEMEQLWSALYVLDGAASRAVRLPGTHTTRSGYGQPVVAGDVVLVPSSGGGVTEILRITP